MIKKYTFFIIICSILVSFQVNAQSKQEFTMEEQHLYDLIMEYRKEKKLPLIPLSKSLNFVAKTHAKDLQNNQPNNGRCNMHSWSKKGNWKACCYTDDHKKASCMWEKPSELTSYKSEGYEIAYFGTNQIAPEEVLETWIKSKGHHQVIINQGIWKKTEWNAIGIAIYENYAVVWFGEEIDE